MTFTLDTTGTVYAVPGGPAKQGTHHPVDLDWSDLSPFAQGYVDAMFASLPEREHGKPFLWDTVRGRWVQVRYDSLAPETLARIIADCEGARDGYRAANTKACGASFWAGRNDPAGCWRYLVTDGFPPLTVNLGDDGKVRFA